MSICVLHLCAIIDKAVCGMEMESEQSLAIKGYRLHMEENITCSKWDVSPSSSHDWL